MRILLLLSSSSVTGPAELCLDDARALREAGHEVIFGCDTRRPGNYVAAIRAAGFELMEELTLCPKPTLGEVARDVARLRRRLKDADLVHCRFAHDHTVTLLAQQGLAKRPAIVRSAEIARALRPGAIRGWGFRSCAAVIVACNEYAQRLVTEHRVEQARVHVLPGRVDSTRFSPGDGSALRRELGVGDDHVLFGIVSRIKVERRHDWLVRSFAKVSARRPEARLAIVGRGEYEPETRALADSLGIAERVHFAGYRTGAALVDAYRAFDVKLWLAEGNDGTCRAVLEGMACGKPAIVARSGAMADIVRHGCDGLAVDEGDASLAAALEQLCDPAARAPMGDEALARAREFSPARRAERLAAIYDAALRTRA